MSSQATAIIPAQLSYFVIYNPSLGSTDETIADQIVFYTSQSVLARRKTRKGKALASNEAAVQENNEQLRHVGLAQGLVNFARDFSQNESVSCVDTEKSRVIIHEIEDGWWILVSINLTKITSRPSGAKPDAEVSVEYSSRELAPANMLLQHLIRKHRLFLLHNGDSLQQLFSAKTRSDFCQTLEKFWTRIVWTWDPLLHGNPAVDIYDGLKVAAGGELGVGVGEEERGSGEREVLEGLVFRTDGVLDLIVSKLGPDKRDTAPGSDQQAGSSLTPGPSDGLVFSGVGEVSSASLRDLSSWMEELYEYGRDAYGVDDRSAARQRRRKARSKLSNAAFEQSKSTQDDAKAPRADGIPPSLTLPLRENKETPEDTKANGRVMRYLTLGYGTGWMGKGDAPPMQQTGDEQGINDDVLRTSAGYFLVGLRGDVEDGDSDEDLDEPEAMTEKILSRSIYIDLKDTFSESESDTSTLSRRTVSVVVYVQAPFVFLLLFKPETPALRQTSFYRSLHHQLGPLRKPLLKSTSRAASSTFHATFAPSLSRQMSKDRPIYTLLYDPSNLTTFSTLPNIPEPFHAGVPQAKSEWSRLEALQVHQLLLATVASTKAIVNDVERTTKTSRGWWVVWMRLPPSSTDRREGSSGLKEAILVRKSSGSDDGQIRDTGGSTRWGLSSVGTGARGMVDGIGVDVRGYVEGLLKFTR